MVDINNIITIAVIIAIVIGVIYLVSKLSGLGGVLTKPFEWASDVLGKTGLLDWIPKPGQWIGSKLKKIPGIGKLIPDIPDIPIIHGIFNGGGIF